ncbi:UDP-glucuronosyltransferase 1-6-like isoform X1 [Scleropages formosus]|uniref:UDP-glucuronosyltransferase 1-6-like isoform X1 n=1 Tax=Scleropages formosus TaxID=113540 RepID=UPI0010FA780E|nr:UDP-glucuronosyltransferase 1-6-like isoform X1 [Scleropages formosus]
MVPEGKLLSVLMLVISCVGFGQTGKLLVLPMDGSHWIGVKALAEEMAQRGHDVVVVIPEVSILLGPSKNCTTKAFSVPYTKDLIENMMNNDLMILNNEQTFLETTIFLLNAISNYNNILKVTGESLFYNQELMSYLRGKQFDALLTDPAWPIGPILGEHLEVPSVYMLRGLPCGLDFKVTACPAPPSFVPRIFTHYSDRMTFPQRTINILVSLVEPLLCKFVCSILDELATRFLQREVTIAEIFKNASVWLTRLDYTFEYPRPLMPNMVMIGGIHCAVRNALPQELETFVNKSGDHGFVVFTLGSMVSQIPEEKAQLFLEAFRQIPQRVLWRYTGPTPANLPQNVKLMKWLPQNDLLGHPKARAFMTHGGTHGLYEGICNGVPMVMMPLFGDQGDNVQRMVTRGVGEVLNIHYTTSEEVVWALNKVINDTSYKEKIQKLSAIHKDRPIEPLDLAVHWTEFVMRHKGAEHLRPAAHNLNWFQYHSLDVIGLLLSVVAIVIAVTVKSCTFCFRKCCRRKTQKKKKE